MWQCCLPITAGTNVCLVQEVRYICGPVTKFYIIYTKAMFSQIISMFKEVTVIFFIFAAK